MMTFTTPFVATAPAQLVAYISTRMVISRGERRRLSSLECRGRVDRGLPRRFRTAHDLNDGPSYCINLDDKRITRALRTASLHTFCLLHELYPISNIHAFSRFLRFHLHLSDAS
jgi:hypothetical protein